ncbi:MAG: Cytochrome c-553-like protein [Cyanobacteriota bacterium]|jgi:mono/diheme cytochrome c family protein
MYVGATSTAVTLAPETLKDQADNLGPLLRRAALVLVAVVAAIGIAFGLVRYIQASDPYIREVLSLEGNVSQGEAIFKMNCAVCHGLEATGEVGPTLVRVSDHRTKVSLIKQVISGQTPPMPQFQPDPQAMADLLDYLESL